LILGTFICPRPSGKTQKDVKCSLPAAGLQVPVGWRLVNQSPALQNDKGKIEGQVRNQFQSILLVAEKA
jgi:hypothetical protein